MDNWFAVAEAGDLGIEAGELAEGRGGLGAVGVEYAGHDLAAWAGGRCVASEQDPGAGKIERDAAGGVAGHGHDDGAAAAEGEFVTVSELAVDPDRRRWCGR